MLVIVLALGAVAGVGLSFCIELYIEQNQMNRLVTRVTAKPQSFRHR